MTIERDLIPPQNPEAEQWVLGAMLIDPQCISMATGMLRPEDFARHSHRLLFEAIQTLHDSKQVIDLITLADLLKRKNELEAVGGLEYIAYLHTLVPTSASLEYHASIVREKSLLRALIELTETMQQRGFAAREEAQALLGEAEERIVEIAQRGVFHPFASLKEILHTLFDYISQAQESGGQSGGLATHYLDLDNILGGGMHPGELILLAARPAMGKTSLAMNIAFNVAARSHKPVAVFSLEMAKEQLVQRMLCSETRIDSKRLKNGQLTGEEWVLLTDTMAALSEAPLFIDDSPQLTVAQMRAKARHLQSEKGGLALVVIDYLQLMQPARRSENRVQEISDISRSLKALARELGVPVLALSQLSRAVEQTQEKRPNLSHLRESGALEQDSDIVLFIYRPDYYFPDSDRPNVAEIIIAKHRNGPTGSIELAFLKEYTRFVNLLRQPVPGNG